MDPSPSGSYDTLRVTLQDSPDKRSSDFGPEWGTNITSPTNTNPGAPTAPAKTALHVRGALQLPEVPVSRQQLITNTELQPPADLMSKQQPIGNYKS